VQQVIPLGTFNNKYNNIQLLTNMCSVCAGLILRREWKCLEVLYKNSGGQSCSIL
jgi:hypothetical protein